MYKLEEITDDPENKGGLWFLILKGVSWGCLSVSVWFSVWLLILAHNLISESWDQAHVRLCTGHGAYLCFSLS